MKRWRCVQGPLFYYLTRLLPAAPHSNLSSLFFYPPPVFCSLSLNPPDLILFISSGSDRPVWVLQLLPDKHLILLLIPPVLSDNKKLLLSAAPWTLIQHICLLSCLAADVLHKNTKSDPFSAFCQWNKAEFLTVLTSRKDFCWVKPAKTVIWNKIFFWINRKTLLGVSEQNLMSSFWLQFAFDLFALEWKKPDSVSKAGRGFRSGLWDAASGRRQTLCRNLCRKNSRFLTPGQKWERWEVLNRPGRPAARCVFYAPALIQSDLRTLWSLLALY